jgi:uncharacterized protein (TIRG00374 family)
MEQGPVSRRRVGVFRAGSLRRNGRRGGWKRLVLLLLFLGFSVLAVSQFTSAREFGLTLGAGVWYWGLLSAALFFGYFYLFAMVFRIGLAIVDVDTTTWHMLPVLCSSIFINTVVPIGAAAGGAVFVEDAVEHGRSGSRTAAGVILVLAVELAAALPFIAVGIGFLAQRGELRFYHIVVSVLFLLFLMLMVAGLWTGKARPQWLARLLGYLQRGINFAARLFKRPGLISDQAVRESTEQFSSAAASIARRPGLVGKVLFVAFVMNCVNTVALYTLFLTYHEQVDLGVLVAGMGMSIAFNVIAITPQGIGAVEGVMALLFVSAGIAPQTAVVVAVSSRILKVWIPLTVGYFFTRRMKVFRPQRRPVSLAGAEGGQAP